MELQLGGLERVGSWNSLDHLAGSRQAEDTAGDANSDPMANKTFVITTILVSYHIVIFEDLYFEFRLRMIRLRCWLSLRRSWRAMRGSRGSR